MPEITSTQIPGGCPGCCGAVILGFTCETLEGESKLFGFATFGSGRPADFEFDLPLYRKLQWSGSFQGQYTNTLGTLITHYFTFVNSAYHTLSGSYVFGSVTNKSSLSSPTKSAYNLHDAGTSYPAYYSELIDSGTLPLGSEPPGKRVLTLTAPGIRRYTSSSTSVPYDAAGGGPVRGKSTTVSPAVSSEVVMELVDEDTPFVALENASIRGAYGIPTESEDCETFTSQVDLGAFSSTKGEFTAKALRIFTDFSSMSKNGKYKVVFIFDEYDISGGVPGVYQGEVEVPVDFDGPADGTVETYFDVPLPDVDMRWLLNRVELQESDSTERLLLTTGTGGKWKLNP